MSVHILFMVTNNTLEDLSSKTYLSYFQVFNLLLDNI